jgi:SAM-dependent methyltransferase
MKMARLASRLVATTPEYWMTRLRARFRKRFPETPEQISARIQDEAPWAARAPFIQQTVQRILEGASVDTVLTGQKARAAGPDIVTYAFLTEWLLRQGADQTLLDVGCLLRNRFTANILRRRGGHVWHCGPAYRKDALDGPDVHYQLFDDDHAFPNADTFPLVACLDFVEHVGYVRPREGRCPFRPRTTPSFEPVEHVLRAIANLTAPGGHMVLGLPCGRSDVRVDTRDKDLAGQVLDGAALAKCLAVLQEGGITAAAAVFHRAEGGWLRAATASSGSPPDVPQGATAVAFIEGNRGGR